MSRYAWSLIGVIGALLGGCRSAGPRATDSPPALRRSDSPPAAPKSVEPAPVVETAPPAESSDAPSVVTTAPAVEDAAALPRYIAILDALHADRRATLRADVSGDDKLVIQTRNVKRMRVRRSDSPLRAHGSVVLRIDGQSFEWTDRFDVLDFELSPAGKWNPRGLGP